MALAARDRQRLELAALHLRKHFGQVGEHDLHLAAHHVIERLRPALVGHVRHLRTSQRAELLAGEVGSGARTARRVIDAASVGLGVRGKFRGRIDRYRRIHHQQQGDGREVRQPHEITRETVVELLVERCVDGMARRGHQQRVAVGVRPGGRDSTDVAVGARLVLHHDRLAEAGRHGLRHGACDHVGGAAGRERHDDAQGMIGVFRHRAEGDNGQYGGHGKAPQRGDGFVHVCLLCFWCLLDAP
ncbi:hypothetical protein D3C81_1205320 [compost metagenome]